MNKETLERMRQMHLYGMMNAFRSSLEGYSSDSMTNDQFVSWLVSNEWDDRCNKTIARLTKNAAFRYTASVEEIAEKVPGIGENVARKILDNLAARPVPPPSQTLSDRQI